MHTESPEKHPGSAVTVTDVDHIPAGFFRRAAAFFYDALLLIALYFFMGGIAVALNGGEALTIPQSLALATVVYPGIAFLFFQWFWQHGGQTLGMQAWRIQLHARSGVIEFKACLLRFGVGLVGLLLLGAGFFWMLVDRKRRTWSDIASGTCVSRTEKH